MWNDETTFWKVICTASVDLLIDCPGMVVASTMTSTLAVLNNLLNQDHIKSGFPEDQIFL